MTLCEDSFILGFRYRYCTNNEAPCLIHYWYKIYPYIPSCYLYSVQITRPGPGPLLGTDKKGQYTLIMRLREWTDNETHPCTDNESLLYSYFTV